MLFLTCWCCSQTSMLFPTCQWILNMSIFFLIYQCFSQHFKTFLDISMLFSTCWYMSVWWCPDKNCEVLVCFVGFDSFTQKTTTENCQFLVKYLGLNWLEFGLSLDLELGRWDGDLQP
jgi:hypothetical protein